MKRITSLILTFVMVLTILPASVFATTSNGGSSTGTSGTTGGIFVAYGTRTVCWTNIGSGTLYYVYINNSADPYCCIVSDGTINSFNAPEGVTSVTVKQYTTSCEIPVGTVTLPYSGNVFTATGSSTNINTLNTAGGSFSTVEFTIPVWTQYGYAVAGDTITLTLPASYAVPYDYEEVDGEYVGKYYTVEASYAVVVNGVSYALGLNNDATTVVSNSSVAWDLDEDGDSWSENDLQIGNEATMGNYDIFFGTLTQTHGYNYIDKNTVIPQSSIVGDNAALTVVGTYSIAYNADGKEALRVSAADFKYYTDPSQNNWTNSKFTTTFWPITQHYEVKAVANDFPNAVSYCWDWNPVNWNPVNISSPISITENIDQSGFGWTYDADTYTLTLTDCNVYVSASSGNDNVISTDSGICAIYSDYNLNIVLKGRNTLDGGIYTEGNLTISGDGSLSVGDFGIWARKNIEITANDVSTTSIESHGGSITLNGNISTTDSIKCSPDTNKTLTINGGSIEFGYLSSPYVVINDGTLIGGGISATNSTGNYYATAPDLIINGGDCTLSGPIAAPYIKITGGDTEVTVTTGNAINGIVTISNGKLTLNNTYVSGSVYNSYGYGIYSSLSSSTLVQSGGEVTINSYNGICGCINVSGGKLHITADTGIFSPYSSSIISGGEVNINSTNCGIYSNSTNGITFTGGDVTITSDKYCISGNASFNGGNVTITADECGIYDPNGTVSFSAFANAKIYGADRAISYATLTFADGLKLYTGVSENKCALETEYYGESFVKVEGVKESFYNNMKLYKGVNGQLIATWDMSNWSMFLLLSTQSSSPIDPMVTTINIKGLPCTVNSDLELRVFGGNDYTSLANYTPIASCVHIAGDDVEEISVDVSTSGNKATVAWDALAYYTGPYEVYVHNVETSARIEALGIADTSLIISLPEGNYYVQVCAGRLMLAQSEEFEITDTVTPGDLNGDNLINDDDVTYLLYHTFFPDTFPVTQDVDFNNDRVVDDDDVTYLLYHTFFPDVYPID